MTIFCCCMSTHVQWADLFRLVQMVLISSIKLQAKQADGQSARRYWSKDGALSVALSAPAPALH